MLAGSVPGQPAPVSIITGSARGLLDGACGTLELAGVAWAHADCTSGGPIPVLLLRRRWGRAAARPYRTRRLRGDVLARPCPAGAQPRLPQKRDQPAPRVDRGAPRAVVGGLE